MYLMYTDCIIAGTPIPSGGKLFLLLLGLVMLKMNIDMFVI